MDLLIISLSKAECINREWDSVPINSMHIFFMLLGVVLFVLGIFGVLFSVIDFSDDKSLATIGAVVISFCVFLIGGGLISAYLHIDNTTAEQAGAVENIRDYHKMKHLRKIYPHLPCKPKVKYKSCNSKSLAKASKSKRIAVHTFTKHKAVTKYNHIRAEYRNKNTQNGGTGFKSLHPYAPRWYDYL